jgi:hypothetical protein
MVINEEVNKIFSFKNLSQPPSPRLWRAKEAQGRREVYKLEMIQKPLFPLRVSLTP